MLCHNPHRPSNISVLHGLSPDQLRPSFTPGEIDSCLTIAEDVDVRGFVVIDEDNDPKTSRAMKCDHRNNPS